MPVTGCRVAVSIARWGVDQVGSGERVVCRLCSLQEIMIAPHHVVERERIGQFNLQMLIRISSGQPGCHSRQRFHVRPPFRVVHRLISVQPPSTLGQRNVSRRNGRNGSKADSCNLATGMGGKVTRAHERCGAALGHRLFRLMVQIF